MHAHFNRLVYTVTDMDKITPGRYVVAVSGGVDSMVLLDMLRQQPGLELVVAHADHGQRPDSPADEALVTEYCRAHGLTFVSKKLRLPLHASEAAAREARWEFLQQCRIQYNTAAIVTAHHQDDLIETAIIALMRGTGWRGLAPFVGGDKAILRPLLGLAKNQLINYARRHNITWREDSTNTDETYLRNYIRRSLIPLLDQKSGSWRAEFLQYIRKQQALRSKIIAIADIWLDKQLRKNNTLVLNRYDIIMAPQELAYELLQHTLWRFTGHTLPRPLAEHAVLFTKVARPYKVMQLSAHWQLRAGSANVIVEPRQTVVSLNEQ